MSPHYLLPLVIICLSTLVVGSMFKSLQETRHKKKIS